MICRVYWEASKAGVLTKTQLPVAEKCEILTQAFSIVGITALIYEQLGFEKFKHPEAFRMLVESYLSEEVRRWSKEFPDELFWQMDRIYGNQKTTSQNRPLYYAKFIRKYVYEPILHGQVLKQLDVKNPKNEKGIRKHRHHSLSSEEIGLPAIRSQIWQVVAALKISADKRRFETNFSRMMGQTWQTELFE
ncbi:MAG TPA: P63C domain-containing protein [Parafilimonas sp.]|nr:P63C domain-containing protein [Parafilimonas sp.]